MSTAQLPTDKVTLYRFQKDANKFCTSPYVNKLDALLTFSGLENVKCEQGSFTKAPRGRFPFIELNGDIIPDSELAYNSCIEKGLVECLDRKAGLTVKETATSLTLQALVEQLDKMMVYERWIDNWYLTRDTFMVVIPALVRPPIAYLFIYRSVSSRMWNSGYAQLSPEERDRDIQNKIEALSTFIPASGYILGKSAPTRIDAIVFGYLMAVFSTPQLSPKAATELHKYPHARNYLDRISSEFWPQRKQLK